eukprot:CAMPEP_0195286636 /NCGR_PEP_ID=MMETSP0707-20130614/4021_1 /TAXON_ID=33640 /ORGANISM="Asterionellopsis glacialis, Strain CCMP134" /LENGTH=582 /DNA_ID=CAMNT_0040346303 /DNA_START=17 /DNA_END=1765 /DNA_ORIENTATION=+
MAFSRVARKVFLALAVATTSTAFTTQSVLRSSSLLRIPLVAAVTSSSSSTSSGTCRNMSTLATDEATAVTTKVLEEQSEAYKKLVTKLQTITQLQRVEAVLNYDQLVFMPHADKTSAERGAQLSALAGLIHEKTTDKEILELITEAESDLESMDGKESFVDESRLLELEKKSFLENERVPAELAAKSASLAASSYAAWVKAREADDFASYEPVLADCFATAKEVAEAKRGDSDIEHYTQMLSQFEMGMPKNRIDEIFEEIQTALVPLIATVLASSTPPTTKPLEGTFPVDKQKDICERIVKSIGFDADLGRIDVSVHPFTTSFSPSDVRITSRFSEDEWYQGLAGTIHEGGHAIYEQNLKSSALTIDSALSMGTHESQSLFWERHVGLSKPFWRWATPMLQEKYDDFSFSAEEVYGAVNAVSRSLIRVEADELTYPLHVILRYGIERDVIEGKLAVKDIPERWNKSMKDMLDVDVPSDSKGCLQDVHWPSLAIGYFPTYLIGSATAAQLSHYCHKDIPDMDEKIEAGEFAEIKEWLTQKVHSHGKRYKSLDALLEDQVGEKLNPKYFIEYLTEKYTDLYKCE